jgi:hypothetical protein
MRLVAERREDNAYASAFGRRSYGRTSRRGAYAQA